MQRIRQTQTNVLVLCVLTVELDRVVTLFQSDDFNVLTLWMLFIESYANAYETLRQRKSITCPTTGIIFESVPAPVVVITDARISSFSSFTSLEY